MKIFILILIVFAFLVNLFPNYLSGRSQPKKLFVEEKIYEGKPHFVVVTKEITWYFDKEGGGFSRMIDRDGNDWISFKREPWGEYPASAASAFRGIPNLVFKSDDGGAGHPGHEKCISFIENNTIVTESKSGKWKWRWEFSDSYAVLEVLKTDPNQAYWFLYEGTPGGVYAPQNYYWGTSDSASTSKLPDFFKGGNVFGHYQYIYTGTSTTNNTFYMLQIKPHDKTDLVGFLGNTKEGVNSANGMTVFGFGRDENGNPLLTGNQKFVVGLYPMKLIKAIKHDEFILFFKSNFEIQ